VLWYWDVLLDPETWNNLVIPTSYFSAILLTFAMLLPRASSSSAIHVLHLPIMHMLLVEVPLFSFGTQLSLLSHLPVLPSRLLNSLLSPSNFSFLNYPSSMSTFLLLKHASLCLSLFFSASLILVFLMRPCTTPSSSLLATSTFTLIILMTHKSSNSI